MLFRSTEGGEETLGRRSKGNKPNSDSVAEAWRLEEVEEAVLLEVFVASLRKAKASAASAKKVRYPVTVLDCKFTPCICRGRKTLLFQTSRVR